MPVPSYQLKFLRYLIWVYFILLLIEGALRKWVFTGFSDVLLIIRDPIVIWIYLIAFTKRCFPLNPFVIVMTGLAFLAVLGAMCSEYIQPMIIAYGLRANFLHLPLIFVMPMVLERPDIEKLGRFALWASLGMTLIMILQFYSPLTAKINATPGGLIGGITGAKGRFRPTGTFSFITGIACFYPMIAAFVMHRLISKVKVHAWLTLVFAMSLILAVPISISRQVLMACGLVGLFALPSAWWVQGNFRLLRRILLLGGLGIFLLMLVPVFSDGLETFAERWEHSTGEDQGGIQGALIDRMVGYLFEPFEVMFNVPFFGFGLGMGSNAGAKILTGSVGFLMGEGEWGRILMEMGPLIGLLFIVFRIALVLHIGSRARAATRRNKDALPFLLYGAALPLIFNGQFNPPTILGFAVFLGGLCLAAAAHPPIETFTR